MCVCVCVCVSVWVVGGAIAFDRQERRKIDFLSFMRFPSDNI